MGNLVTSARTRLHRHGEDPIDASDNPYRYPPREGASFFSTHYHLGHRKFETGDPEVFLFGELNDINFLNPRPVAFPYKQPPRNQPVKCLRSYINIQRDSAKLKKCEGSEGTYTIEFEFDSDVACRFTVYTRVPDTVDPDSLRNGSFSGEGVGVSRSFHYSAGSSQVFKEEGFTISPEEFGEELTYDPENEQRTFPVVILMETDDPQAPESQQQAHISLCNLDSANGNGYSIKTFKQKLIVEGVEYLLQEIYGLENKTPEEESQRASGDDSDSDDDEDDIEELGAECVICISDVRDTLLLPCRHLCLCSGCAANLRYQSSNCPVCRAPFRALLQIQALQTLDPDELIDDDERTGNPKYSTPGYKCVPLLQALNGYKLDRDDVGPEPTSPASQENEGETEEEEAERQRSNAQSPTDTQRTTEFCVVVPIEEDLQEDVGSSLPAQPPVRKDMAKRRSSGSNRDSQKLTVVDVEEASIPLPGTPTSDDDEQGPPPSSQASSRLSGKLVLNLDVEQSNDSPDSPVSSHSFSSRGSTKSTDVLLPDK